GVLHLLARSLPQEPVVDEDALQLPADRLVQQERDYRAVHAAAHRADHPIAAHLRADLLRRLFDEGAHAEAEGDPAVLEEGLVDLLAARGVDHFGVELDSVKSLLRIAHRAVRGIWSFAQYFPALGRSGDLVAVRHPDVEVLAGVQIAEGSHGLGHLEAGWTVLAVCGPIDGAAQQLGHQLQAVADAEDRDAELEHPRVDQRRAFLLPPVGTAGKDDAARGEGLDLLERHRAGVDLAVDVQLADAAGDQLRVLRAEIEDEDFFCVDVRHRPSSGGAV